MSEFDSVDYFNRRANELAADTQLNPPSDKLQSLNTALIRARDALSASGNRKRDALEANNGSWTAKLGLDPQTAAGQAVNLGASVYSGAARLVGDIAGFALGDLEAIVADASLTDEEIAAIGRHKQGKGRLGEFSLITRKNPDHPTDPSPLERFNMAVEARKRSASINKALDVSSVVDTGRRDELSSQLGENFQGSWDQTKAGAKALWGGDVGGSVDLASGLAKLIYNAGEAAITHPGASLEYVAENVPQLVTGVFGKVGKVAMLTSNVGYASEKYQEGIAKFQAENGGAYPPPEERQRMAAIAASLALVEHVSDLGQLKAAGGAAKALEETGKTGVVQALKNSAKAGAVGGLEETIAEGYQTWGEGEASRTPASALEIYQGATIGGIAGGGMSGGGRLIGEAMKATPEHAAERAVEQTRAEAQKVAATSGDVSALLDQKSGVYDPAGAIAALSGHSAAVAPEVKQANLTKAGEIVGELEKQRAEIQTTYDQVSPEGVKLLKEQLVQAKAAGQTERAQLIEETLADVVKNPDAHKELKLQLSKIDRRLEKSREQFTRFNEDLNTGDVDVPAQVEAVNAADPVASPRAAETLINLSMAIPERLDAEVATSLADNTSNALSTGQRTYLRAFSAARVAENMLKDTAGVSQEIYTGGSGNVGIAQHRARVAAALAADNRAVADQQLNVLRKFEADHKAKAEVVAQAWGQGKGTQVAKTKDGQWIVAPVPRPHAEVRKNGGLTVNTRDLVTSTKTEAAAITATLGELEAAYALKFNQGASDVQNVPEAHPSASTPTNPGAEPKAPVVGPAASGGGSAVRAAGTADVEAPRVADESQSTSVDQASRDAVKTTAFAEGSSQSTNGSSVGAVANTTEAVNADDVMSDTKSEASPESAEQTVAEPEQKAAVQPGKLTALSEKSVEGTVYSLRNIIADYFTQSAGNEVDKTKRPLVEVKNFLSEGWATVGDYLESAELKETQTQVLRVFQEKAAAWGGSIQESLTRKTREFWVVDDLVQFLMTEEGGKLDLEENVKTAMVYAGFSWVAENATRSPFNDKDAIREILGLDDTAIVEPDAERLLGNAGTRQNVVINAIGQRAVQALGLKAAKDAPLDLMPKLESHMGAYVFKLLMDQGILERSVISGEDMAALTGNTATDKSKPHPFIKMARVGDLLSEEAEEIYQASKGTQGILDKLFSVEAGLKEPGRAPIPFTQTKTKNTDQAVPESLAKVVEHENAVASYVDGSMFDLVQHLDEGIVLEMAGAEHVDANIAHKVNRSNREAKNDGLKRELQRAKEFFTGLVAEDADLTMPLYFDHSVWKQQRVGIATNVVNPQSSKIHRHMLFRKTWETAVARNDAAQMENFHLRIAEGLGIKTDKQSNEKSLAAFSKKLTEPAIKEAVKLVQKRLAGNDLSMDEQKDLLLGVQAGKENFHSLSALMALAQEANAVEAKQDTFVVRLMSEVDGVTNGPMLSHLALGAASSVADLFKLLNRGGFYEQGNEHSQYNLWREAAGHFDLYETTALHMTQAVQGMLNKKPGLDQTLNAIYAFTGTLAKDGRVERDGRNIIKTPLTAMVFGSSVPSAVESMANNFVESIYAKIEDAAQKGTSPVTLLENLDLVLAHGGAPYMPSKMTIAELMEYEFTKEQVAGLKNAFKDTIGKAVGETMNADFAEFIKQRKQFNEAAQLSFELYNAVHAGLREEMIAKLVKSGDIAVNAKTGRPLHDLTAAQEGELRKRLAKMAPVIHTAMSKESGSLKAGLYAAKSARKLSTKNTYEGEVKFATKFPDGTKSTTTRGYETVESSPGVAMLVMSIHSTDSKISHSAAAKGEVLNVHDAHGAGLTTFEQTARNLNRATWESMLDYSPAAEMQAALSRTVVGLADLITEGTLPASVMEKLTGVINKLAGKRKGDAEVAPENLLITVMEDMKATAFQADTIKLGALAQMQSIDQYALQGGNYEVTDGDREAVAKRQAELSHVLSPKETKAIARISTVLQGLQKGEPETNIEDDVLPTPNPFGELGTPVLPSDPGVVAIFEGSPRTSAGHVQKELFRLLSARGGRTNEFYLELLRKLSKVVPADLRVQMITPQTDPKDIMFVSDSIGFYSPRGSYKGAFLMGPEFKHSGLTAEVVLHEMLHAALFEAIEADSNNPLVKELDLLRQLATVYVMQNDIKNTNGMHAALANVHEFVSWGLTNQQFQREVLNKISMSSRNAGLVNGMKAFIERLVGILFKGSTKSQEDIAFNGMSVLISNVAGLMAQAEQANAHPQKGNNITLSMAAPDPLGMLQTYSTMDIHEALSPGDVTPSFDVQLRTVLSGIVEKLHGPYGAFKAALMKDQALTPMDVWMKALATGVVPFASSVQASPLKVSEQEAHVMEQVEATMQAALSHNEVTAKTAYKELDKLYTEMRARIKPSDFGSQDEYDFIFKIESGVNGRSDHLARFVAFGLANQQVNALLQVPTSTGARQGGAKTFAERVQILFEQVLEFFHSSLTRTYGGQRADEKLNTLVSQLVDIEAKKRLTLARRATEFNPVANLEAMAKDAADSLRAGVAKAAGSDFIRKHQSAFVRGAGGLVRTYANDQAEWLMKGIAEIRDQGVKGKYGLAMGMLNEVRGPGKILNSLMLAATNSQRLRKQIISNTGSIAQEAFANAGKDLDKTAKKSISSVFLRTGLHALISSVNMTELENLLSDSKALDVQTKEVESELSEFGRFKDHFIHQANALAYFKVTGLVRTEKLMMNAYNISRLFGTSHVGRLTPAQSARAEATIEKLVALYAIGYTGTAALASARDVLRTENARTDGKGNGVEFVLALHKRLEQESKDRLFQGQKALVMHGYTPEICNPNTEVLVADQDAGADLLNRGYSKVGPVQRDGADPDQDKKSLYVLKDGGLMPYLTGVISYTGKRAKGSTKHSGYLNVNTAEGLENASKNADILSGKAVPLAFGPRPDLSTSKVNHMAPVVNPKGEIVNWRYLMADSTKDGVLERDNRFDRLLGALAGSIYDKETTAELNAKVVEALHEQYKADKAISPDAFLLVGPKSTDPELREVWGMLPEDTKAAVRKVWGSDGMLVRKDALTVVFGYRKRSLAEAFDKDESARNMLENMFVGVMEHVMSTVARVKDPKISLAEAEAYAKRAAVIVRKGERAWQELVHEVKDILVVKTGTVMMGNIWSNLSLLALSGVPMADILKNHLVALRGARAFQHDTAELARLQAKLDTGLTLGQAAEINQQVARLKDALSRNPVKELIDAGLMPTIVEDVAQDDDIYSYKTALVRRTDRFTEKLNPILVAGAKNVYMSHDTRVYQGLSRITQLSDFVARYTLYQHLTTRKANPLSKADAVFEASEAFINYDIPMHPGMQYLDDMGVLMFTKYFMRIQRVLARLARDNPGRVLMTVALGNFLSLGPIVLDSSAVTRVGNNPFGIGALQLPATLDELATVSAGMALLK